MTHKILVLPGDGIGPEICNEASKVIEILRSSFGFACDIDQGLIGGCAYDEFGSPYPDETHAKAEAADAILMGAVGGPKWDAIPREDRPERGLLAIRSRLELFANLRPALTYAALASASSLKPSLVAGLDILIVRELTGGIYFGEPRGIEGEAGNRIGFNTLVYSESEIRRIARVGFEAAQKRNKRLCSVDKANVLESMMLWREVVSDMASDYPDVELSHMYVDNAAMQLVRAPKQFDVVLTGNMFGDILSDCAAMLTGSIGMLPSASMNQQGKGLFEPVHGSAPDITGQNKANPLATILSLSMLLRYSLDEGALADKLERAVDAVLAGGARTADIAEAGMPVLSTSEMGDAVCKALAGE